MTETSFTSMHLEVAGSTGG